MTQRLSAVRTAGDVVPGVARGMAASDAAAPVARELVHRTSEHEVLPTGWTRLDDSHFSVSVRWPRDHRCFAPVGGHHDALLVAETMRQATILLAHAEMDVPLNHHFVMWGLEYSVTDVARLALDDRPDAVETVVTCSEVQRRGNRLSSMRTEYVLWRAGRVLATGRARLTCTSAQVYARLRGERLAAAGLAVPLLPAVPPEQVGRTAIEDVALAPVPQERAWRLRVDSGHPSYFHRPNDHVPGMLLLEAARQAAHSVSSAERFVPTAVDVAFHRYAELDSPCWITAGPPRADPWGGRTVRVSGHQDNELVFLATLAGAAPDEPDEWRSR
ncbi:ScbA/BarX family gamma-butyrolactone biosynthesis protein [Streptomyces silvisoli]|uniref:ScbA/BarX family gamma-butyrolactone biosynthesis protein n=1 Tax=Streptomyces silvisoli TaxID=3034235 RepID=A0ABT5ZNL7_9ACTN|nr:ScbA/BarX family gamma-butyrolactone biosynthesis protein [Streptomyces silvisoli]MDF3291397.1 ScbA/BarX family gamma-butyrolactone biosynthesis protein [Streptomyces silvisoli]